MAGTTAQTASGNMKSEYVRSARRSAKLCNDRHMDSDVGCQMQARGQAACLTSVPRTWIKSLSCGGAPTPPYLKNRKTSRPTVPRMVHLRRQIHQARMPRRTSCESLTEPQAPGEGALHVTTWGTVIITRLREPPSLVTQQRLHIRAVRDGASRARARHLCFRVVPALLRCTSKSKQGSSGRCAPAPPCRIPTTVSFCRADPRDCARAVGAAPAADEKEDGSHTHLPAKTSPVVAGTNGSFSASEADNLWPFVPPFTAPVIVFITDRRPPPLPPFFEPLIRPWPGVRGVVLTMLVGPPTAPCPWRRRL